MCKKLLFNSFWDLSSDFGASGHLNYTGTAVWNCFLFCLVLFTFLNQVPIYFRCCCEAPEMSCGLPNLAQFSIHKGVNG